MKSQRAAPGVLTFAPADTNQISNVFLFLVHLCSAAELTIGVICACLPACGILIARSRNTAAALSHASSSYFSSKSTKFMYAIKSITFLRTKPDRETARRTAAANENSNNNNISTTVMSTRRRDTVLANGESHPGTNVAELYLGSRWVTPPSTSNDGNESSRTRIDFLVFTNDNTPARTAVEASTELDTDVERGGS